MSGPSELGGLRAVRAAAEYLLLTHSLPTFGTQEQDMAWEGLSKALDYAGPAAQPPPSTVPCSLSNWEKAPAAGEQAVAFVRAAVAANRGVDLDVLRAFLKEYDAPQPPPEVSAGAAMLAEVLGAIRTYDQSMFSDQHRALFERLAAGGAAVPSQPEVSAWLCERFGPVRDLWAQPPKRLGGYEDCSTTTGAGAVGSWVNPGVSYRKLLEVVRQVAASFDVGADEDAIDCIADAAMTAAEADRKVCCPDCLQWSWHGPDAERKVIDHYLKVHAAPPAAPGVAELLAECRRQQAEAGWSTARMTCDEIVRLLAPGGANGTEAGT